MSTREKLLESIKRNPKDRSFEELVSLLRKYGFIVNESKGKGSHCPVYHSEYRELRWTISRRKPMKAYHAKKVVELIEGVINHDER